MKRRGFLDEAALGLAEAVASDRVFAGAVLLASTLLFRDIRWIVGAAFLAGFALRGTSWKLRWPLFVAASLVMWTCIGPFSGTLSADLLTGGRWIRVVMPLRVALMLACAGAGMRSWKLATFGVVLAIGACLVRDEGPDWWMAAIAGVSGVVLMVGAFGRPRVAMTVGLVMALGVALFLRPHAWQTIATLLPDIALAGWLVIAGLSVRAAGAVTAGSGTARLLALSQTYPWAAVTAVAAMVLFHDGGAPLMSGGNPSFNFVPLIAVSFGASLVAALGVRSQSPLGALASLFWLSMALMTTWIAERAVLSFAPSMTQTLRTYSALAIAAIARTAVALLWPVALAQILRGQWPSMRPRIVFHALLAALAMTPGWVLYVDYDRPYSDLDWVGRWEWIVFAPIVFVAATGCAATSRRIVLTALGIGLASTLAVAVASRVTQLRAGPWPLHRDDVLANVGVWCLGGVYVVIARRANSLTAVPLDHPSVPEAA